jgi:copper transport protein
VKRFLLACALAIAAVLRIYTIASAHVTLVASTPAANSHLEAPPAQIRLEFSEPVEAKVAHVVIVHPDGHTDSLAVTSDPHNGYVLLAAPKTFGSGAYRVLWHVVSVDGHPVGGNFSFHIGSGFATDTVPAIPVADRTASTTGGPSMFGAPMIPAVLRGLGVGSLAALAGLLFFAVSNRALMDSRPLRVALWLSIVAFLLLLGHLTTWIIHTSPDHKLSVEWIATSLSSDVGRMELWRTALALMPLWALILARRPLLALVLTMPALFVSAAVGHSAAFHPTLSVPLKALHLVALAAWVGGLMWLVVRERTDVRTFATEASRVSTVALWGVVAIAASGVAQTLLLFGSLSDLQSSYGFVVLLKVVGLLALVGFGAYHRFRVMPRLMMGADVSAAFTISLRREIAVVWLVVVLGGVLAYVSPPAAGAPQPTPTMESAP